VPVLPVSRRRALRRRGITAEVLEGWRIEWQRSGAGLYLPGNAERALHEVGIGSTAAARANPNGRQRFLDHRGRPLANIDLDRIWDGAGGWVARPSSEGERRARETSRRLAGTVVGSTSPMPAVTPLHPASARFEGGLTEVAPGIHAWLQPNGLLGESNAGLVVGDGASLLVDTLWDPRLTRRMLAAMKALTAEAPIETLVNTHSDGDHWWGNQEVAGAEIVATEAAAAVMAEQSPGEMKRFGLLAGGLRLAGSMPLPYPRRREVGVIAAYVSGMLKPFAFDEVRLVPPTRTFSGELQLDIGGREVRLIEVGPAHTPGDLIVWVRDARIALAADILFIGVTPIMWAGPLAGWIAALERLLELGAERFVPGHGPVCGPDEVRRLIDYWRWLERAAEDCLEAGSSPAEAARELVLGEEIAERGFGDWLGPERALVSVGTIDAHRRGVAKLPGPRELVAAFFRMAVLARDLEARRAQ
jgi:cyclase